MSWLRHKLYRYEVTIGLYGLEWWERYIFNTMVLMLLWFTCSKMLKTSAHSFLFVLAPGRYLREE
ncbi:unnamed protein product [Spirodela intermedia]|uniref:Uncharacterized protein n=1 Tax=Spirodela intermedia TaxID=51605 RepID=A0A7I8LFA3_SPIIN|nr:unnamed protein product [Spirodela intermedia]